MIDIETYHGIGRSISHRASLMAELLQKLAEQDTRDRKLRELLLQKAPSELHEWLNEDMILSSLFTHGLCDTKISYNDDYGFSDLADVKAKLGKLRKAWKDVVLIKISTAPESHRVQVWFSAVL